MIVAPPRGPNRHSLVNAQTLTRRSRKVCSPSAQRWVSAYAPEAQRRLAQRFSVSAYAPEAQRRLAQRFSVSAYAPEAQRMLAQRTALGERLRAGGATYVSPALQRWVSVTYLVRSPGRDGAQCQRSMKNAGTPI